MKEGGEEARDYVQAQMGKAKTIVIQTNKIDIYGRYIGWVFYSLDARDSWEKVFGSGGIDGTLLQNLRGSPAQRSLFRAGT